MGCYQYQPRFWPPTPTPAVLTAWLDRLMFAGDAMFQVAFDHPDWHNGFEHDPEEAARVRVRLLRELAATREPLVTTHLPFPSVCHVAVAWRRLSLGTGRLGLLTAERDWA